MLISHAFKKGMRIKIEREYDVCTSFLDFVEILEAENVNAIVDEYENKFVFAFDINGNYVYAVEFDFSDALLITSGAYNNGTKFALRSFAGNTDAEEIWNWILNIETEEDLDFNFEFAEKKETEKEISCVYEVAQETNLCGEFTLGVYKDLDNARRKMLEQMRALSKEDSGNQFDCINSNKCRLFNNGRRYGTIFIREIKLAD